MPGVAAYPVVVRWLSGGGDGLRQNGPVPVDMSRERFEELVADALDEVPQELLDLMSNVVVLVEDEPPEGEPELLGVYEGHALTSRGWDYSGVLPDRILIYRQPILRICDNDDDVIDEVAITVVHEIAHHFGIDDERLHELGWA
jgi:predicted Zn-dependent protease with MMP-like domain